MPVKMKAVETTWLEDIAEFSFQDAPGGLKLLTYTLSNGHRYVLPLKGEVLAATQRAVSPVVLPGAGVPHNGHRA
jgi:hypothetical protein